MNREELEKKYTISISYNGHYYMVFNYFGKLWFTAKNLEEIDHTMEEIYRCLN